MKTVLIALAVAAALSGCYGKPQTQESVTPDFSVARLFTYDGCTVYRFNDGGARYFTRCDSGSSSAAWQEGCGKNCTRSREISTGLRKEAP